jgi:hypothetical protein
MKTKSIYLVAFLLMSAVATFGNNLPKAEVAVVPSKGSEVFKVIYKAEAANKVKVNLYNSKSELIFSEIMGTTAGFILPLNFTKLNFGEYKLELIDATGKRTENISYQPAKTVQNIRISKLGTSNDKFLVSVMSATNEKVTVRIFDHFNNLLHNEVTSVSGAFAQVYTVKNLSGTCTFEVSDAEGRIKTVQF